MPKDNIKIEEQKQATTRLVSMDFVRVLALLGVILFHVSGAMRPPDAPPRPPPRPPAAATSSAAAGCRGISLPRRRPHVHVPGDAIQSASSGSAQGTDGVICGIGDVDLHLAGHAVSQVIG